MALLLQVRGQLAELAWKILVDQQDAHAAGLETPGSKRYVEPLATSPAAMDASPSRLLMVLGLPHLGPEPLRRALELCGAAALPAAALEPLQHQALEAEAQ
jgi:hypothetical protein